MPKLNPLNIVVIILAILFGLSFVESALKTGDLYTILFWVGGVLLVVVIFVFAGFSRDD